MQNDPEKVSFLLGSGASVPANFPTVHEITDEVLNDTPCANLRQFYHWLEVGIRRRYGSEVDHAVHYENLYFLAKQLHDDLLGEYDNPAILPFLEAAIKELLPQTRTLHDNAWQKLQKLTEAAMQHIRHIVSQRLAPRESRCDHLSFIPEALDENAGSIPAILTVNHDTLLEQLLSKSYPCFLDGFEHQPNRIGVRKWDPGQLTTTSNSLRVLKLHGGVDWYRLRPSGVQTDEEDYFGIKTPQYSDRKTDLRGRTHELIESVFLIGSWDKLARYTDAVYVQLYYSAFQSLTLSDVLIVVGYGFGDKGINKMITNWMCQPSHRLVVIDRSLDNPPQGARPVIYRKWSDWRHENRLFHLQCDLKDRSPSWPEIKQRICARSVSPQVQPL